VGLIALDMSALDRKNGDGKTLCNVPKIVKAVVRAGTEDISHRKNVFYVFNEYMNSNLIYRMNIHK
jgi:hypothetical protein